MTLPKFEQTILLVLGGMSAVALMSIGSDKLTSRPNSAVAQPLQQPAAQPFLYRKLDADNAAIISTPSYAVYQIGSPILAQPTPIPVPPPTTVASGGLVLHSLAKNYQNPFAGQAAERVRDAERVTVTADPLPIMAAVATNPDRPRSSSDSSRKTGAPKPDMPVEISIPAINLSANVQEMGVVKMKTGGDTWSTPKGRAAGWHNDSARLGERGNVVLNGHNNIDGKVFERLQELKAGQKVILRSKTREVTYVLYDKTLLLERGQPASVLMDHAKYLLPTPDDRLTLVTCWPNWDNSHRLLWFARPVDERFLAE
ncbi:MAG: sortase [Anaerolineae bacterium]|nr:sortase [Anaerolineae bacterium]